MSDLYASKAALPVLRVGVEKLRLRVAQLESQALQQEAEIELLRGELEERLMRFARPLTLRELLR